MTVEVQYNNLNEIDGSIRLTIRGTANFIVARRIARNTVHVLDEVVADANKSQGYGQELVEALLQECVNQGVSRVEIKENQNPSWWERAKGFRNGHLLKT